MLIAYDLGCLKQTILFHSVTQEVTVSDFCQTGVGWGGWIESTFKECSTWKLFSSPKFRLELPIIRAEQIQHKGNPEREQLVLIIRKLCSACHRVDGLLFQQVAAVLVGGRC